MGGARGAAQGELDTLRRRVRDLEARLAREREVEEELRKSEELHRVTLGHISDAVFLSDDAGSLVYVCPNVDVIFGWQRDEVRAFGNIAKLLGENLFEPPVLARLGEIANIEREITDKAGAVHALIVNVKRVSIQGATVLYTCRDISDRKRVEDALRQSEERLLEAQHVARMGFWDWDIVSNDLYWSDEIYRIFGLGRDEFGATYDAFLASVHPEDRDFVRRRVEAAVDDGEEYSIDHRILTPAGEVRHVHELGKVERDVGGAALRMIGTVVDVTARKLAREAEWQAERRARAAEEMASLGTLAAGIAHDVGTPVNVILGYARLMEKSLPAEKDRERARVIAEQAQRVTALIRTLLNVARPGERIPVPVCLGQTLDEALSFVREKLHGAGIQVQRRFEPVREIHGDPDRLQRLFLNLFLNAADAMPEGGTLEVALRDSGSGGAVVEVRDTGSGIDPEDLARIFDPFYTTKPRGEGSGLGLLVSRRIVAEHGGEIDVSSEVGRGTCFRIRLPAAGACRVSPARAAGS
jgi:two-component system, sporulation sensor kinase E